MHPGYIRFPKTRGHEVERASLIEEEQKTWPFYEDKRLFG